MDKLNIKKSESIDSEYFEDELSMLEAKRNTLFELVQSIYSKSLLVDSDEESRERFLDAVDTIEELRSEFKELVNDHNRTLLKGKTGAAPNYQPIIAFEDLYCRIRRVLKRLEPAAAPLALPPVRVGRPIPALPAMELMSFDGDIRNWPLFYASFKSRVHDNPSLTNDERLYYLIGKLSPKAQAVFAGITPCADNYELILESLVDRFHDKRTLASTYLDQMLNLKMNGPASSSNFQTFIDKFVTAANALKSLKLGDLCDYILLHVALKKLDQETIRAFEMQYRNVKIPTFKNLADFVKSQYRIYQNTQATHPCTAVASTSRDKFVKPPLRSFAPNPQSYVASANLRKCICDSIVHEHLFKCPAFNNLSPSDRFKCVKERFACLNCLSIKPKTRDCNSELKCRHCQQKHHTMLHFDNNKNQVTSNVQLTVKNEKPATFGMPHTSAILPSSTDNVKLTVPPQNVNSSSSTPIAAQVLAVANNKAPDQSALCMTPTILLSTAKVVIRDNAGCVHRVKCLLDSASQSNFITQECCARLGLSYNNDSRVTVRGIGGAEKPSKGTANFKIFSRFNENVSFNVSGLVVDTITDDLPSVSVEVSSFSHINGLPLADDSFDTPAAIDVLLGASIFPHLILPNVVHSDVIGVPPAIQSVLGYIIMGSAPALQVPRKFTSTCCAFVQDSLDHLLKSFWELEEISAPPAHSQDDIECEDYFRATTTRDASGRYTVALPFRDDVFKLGESYSAAHRRFLCLERKLESSSALRAAYDDIIREYVNKGYISEVTSSMKAAPAAYIIPHHAVVREDKTSTKKLHLLSAPQYSVERITISNCGSRVCVWGSRGVTVVELPSRWGRGGLFDDGSETVLCKSFSLDERFLYSQGEVRRVQWHPSSLSHLWVLVSDNTIRLYNIALKSGPKLVKIFPIGPKPSGLLASRPLLDSLGDTAVDFTTTPGSDSLLILRGNGDVYMMDVDLEAKTLQHKLTGPLVMYPPADDNYGSESCSITALSNSQDMPPLVVVATCSAQLYHCLLLPNATNKESDSHALYVVEAVELNIVLNPDDNVDMQYSYPVHLYPCTNNTYACMHAGGVHTVTLPVLNNLKDYALADEASSESQLSAILSRASVARHLVCTAGPRDLRPPAGLALTPPPLPKLLLLCTDATVLSRTLEPYDLEEQLYKELQLQNPALEQDDINNILKERQKLSFTAIIQEVLSREISQPILNINSKEEPSPKESLEFLTQATLKLRGEYMSRQQRAVDAIARKLVALQSLSVQHDKWYRDLQKDIEDVTLQSTVLKEKALLAEKHQDDIKYRCSAVIRKLRASAPATPAERELLSELERYRRSGEHIAGQIQLLKAHATTKHDEFNKWQDEYKRKDIALGKSHSDTISSILQQQTSKISTLIEETKLLKDQLSIV